MSMDAEALYPSLSIEDILSGVWTLVTESDLHFKEVDVREIGMFLAVMYSKDELKRHKVISAIPRRQTELDGTSRGAPTIAYLDSNTYTRRRAGVEEKGVPKWEWSRTKQPTDKQRSKMVALALMAVIQTALRNHVYKFDGRIYRQRRGVP